MNSALLSRTFDICRVHQHVTEQDEVSLVSEILDKWKQLDMKPAGQPKQASLNL